MPKNDGILIVDIESSPHLAFHWGRLWDTHIVPANIIEPTHMMCFAAKWHNDKKVMFYSTFHNGKQEMLQAWHDLLSECEILVSYNGKRFDVPHGNRELLEAGFAPPSPYRHVDLDETMKRVFMFESHGLDFVTQRLKIGAKIKHEGMQLWLDCMNDKPKAWARFKRYCSQDVLLTDKLYTMILPWIKGHPNRAHDHEAGQLLCPTCTSPNLRREGHAYTDQGRFQRYQCRDCGRWSRGTHRDPLTVPGVTAIATQP